MRTTAPRSPRALLFLLASVTCLGPLGCGDMFSTVSDAGADASDEASDNPGIPAPDASKSGATDATADAPDAHRDAGDDASDDALAEASPEASSSCALPSLECASGCVPSDVHNCGTCGHDCTNLPHVSGAVSCTAGGACAFAAGSCSTGWADCDGNPDNGCETDLSQTAHCGACSTPCGTSAPVCAGSGGTYACVTGCSGATSLLCSGTCVDPTSNPGHCDTCANACGGVMNGQPACVSSACSFTCNTGYTGCPTAAPTGCVDEQSDVGNCGSCGKTCAASTNGGGQPSCNAGACGLTCNPGLTGCPTAAPSECDDTTSDVDDCGSCGNVCPGVTNGTPECASSQCTFTCNTGFQKCNNDSCIPVADGTNGVFVSQSKGSGSTCTEAAPCATIGAALAVVAGGGKSIVYLDQATYTEQVTLPAATFTIQGGWTFSGGNWTNCDGTASTSIIAAPAGTSAAVLASTSGTWTLDTLTIKNPTTASPGQSLYGVFETAGALTLTNVSVVVAAGGAASSMGPAGMGTAGAASCTAASSGAGAPGTPGPVGLVGGQGTYGATGFVAGNGQIGQPGGAGTNGGTGAFSSDCSSNACVFQNQAAANCTSMCCTVTTVSGGTCEFAQGLCPLVCGAQGGVGCAGGGGGAGAGGLGGGASIGVFAANSTATISTATIATGTGGAGGNGGAGGPGGTGSTGAPTGSISIAVTCSANPVATKVGPTTEYECTGGTTRILTPGASSTGGNGGLGGQGSGGAGGDSLCYATGPGGTVNGTPTCNAGAAGAGGNQSVPGTGPTGRTGVHN